MTNSSILGGAPAPANARGRDVDSLGPSDSSDSGSDVQGERPMATGAAGPDEVGSVVVDTGTDSDALGTGERASADGRDPRDGADILPDRIDSSPDGDAGEDGDAGIDLGNLAAPDDDEDTRDAGDVESIDPDADVDAGRSGAGRTGSEVERPIDGSSRRR